MRTPRRLSAPTCWEAEATCGMPATGVCCCTTGGSFATFDKTKKAKCRIQKNAGTKRDFPALLSFSALQAEPRWPDGSFHKRRSPGAPQAACGAHTRVPATCRLGPVTRHRFWSQTLRSQVFPFTKNCSKFI